MSETLLENIESKVVVKSTLKDFTEKIYKLDKELNLFQENYFSELGSDKNKVISEASVKLNDVLNDLGYVYEEM